MCLSLVASARGGEQDLDQRRPIWHIMGYGQSLSLGTLGIPPLTVEPSKQDLMFGDGIRRSPKQTPELKEFVPLAETADRARGETGIAAATETFRDTLEKLRGDQPEKLSVSILGSSTGRSGARLKALRPASPNYNWLVEYAAAGAKIAHDNGQDYRYLATLFSHGETDHLIGTSREVYSKGLVSLADAIAKDTGELDDAPWTPPFLAYQPASHRAYLARDRPETSEIPEIALAIRDADRSSDLIFCILPMYIGDFKGDIHARNVTYQHVGKLFGRALAKLVYARESGTPAPPVSLDLVAEKWSGNEVALSFSVPKPPIAFDTQWVTEAPNMGFDLWSPEGDFVADGIRKVTITSPTEVTVSFAKAPPSGSRISYAFGRPEDPYRGGRTVGPRGNLRDSEGEPYTDAYGVVRPMNNWALIFEAVKP